MDRTATLDNFITRICFNVQSEFTPKCTSYASFVPVPKNTPNFERVTSPGFRCREVAAVRNSSASICRFGRQSGFQDQNNRYSNTPQLMPYTASGEKL